jgi:hypothetical protein
MADDWIDCCREFGHCRAHQDPGFKGLKGEISLARRIPRGGLFELRRSPPFAGKVIEQLGEGMHLNFVLRVRMRRFLARKLGFAT